MVHGFIQNGRSWSPSWQFTMQISWNLAIKMQIIWVVHLYWISWKCGRHVFLCIHYFYWWWLQLCLKGTTKRRFRCILEPLTNPTILMTGTGQKAWKHQCAAKKTKLQKHQHRTSQFHFEHSIRRYQWNWKCKVRLKGKESENRGINSVWRCFTESFGCAAAVPKVTITETETGWWGHVARIKSSWLRCWTYWKNVK